MCLLLTMAWFFPLWPTAGNRLATISYWHLGYLLLPALQSEWMSSYPFFIVPKARLSASLSPVVGFLGLFSVSGCMLWLGSPADDAAGSRIATHLPRVVVGYPSLWLWFSFGVCHAWLQHWLVTLAAPRWSPLFPLYVLSPTSGRWCSFLMLPFVLGALMLSWSVCLCPLVSCVSPI